MGSDRAQAAAGGIFQGYKPALDNAADGSQRPFPTGAITQNIALFDGLGHGDNSGLGTWPDDNVSSFQWICKCHNKTPSEF
jgi:hypothetical protein